MYIFVMAAGLTRTCEVFSVQGLVLSDLKVLEDKHFQGISVTAERWLPLHEVSGVICVVPYPSLTSLTSPSPSLLVFLFPPLISITPSFSPSPPSLLVFLLPPLISLTPSFPPLPPSVSPSFPPHLLPSLLPLPPFFPLPHPSPPLPPSLPPTLPPSLPPFPPAGQTQRPA